jgi:MYXO-CTERM domain-containing protein
MTAFQAPGPETCEAPATPDGGAQAPRDAGAADSGTVTADAAPDSFTPPDSGGSGGGGAPGNSGGAGGGTGGRPPDSAVQMSGADAAPVTPPVTGEGVAGACACRIAPPSGGGSLVLPGAFAAWLWLRRRRKR